MADDKELTILKSDPLPELSIVSSETAPVSGKPTTDAEWTALKQQHGLPASYDLSKTLVENYGNLSKNEINGIDLNKLQDAYAIANPTEARKPGFFNNIFGEASDIVKGLFSKADTVAGSPSVGPSIEAAKDNPVNLVPVVGPMAVQRGRQIARGDYAGAMGAGVTDLAALLAPIALHKAIEAVPKGASSDTLMNTIGKNIYDPKTGKLIDLKEATLGAIARKVIPNPYEEQIAYEQKAQDLMRRGKEQSVLDRQAAREASAAAKKAPPTTSPAGTLLKPGGKIVDPNSAPLPINKTYVSYPRLKLAAMAKTGDLAALRELVRNPGSLDLDSAVPNWRFLIDKNSPGVVYGGPE